MKQAEQRALITGSTGGIGAAITELLALSGWSLILMNRDQSKSARQADTLLKDFPDPQIEQVQADFMDLDSICRACAEITDRELRIDALFNIAGVLTSEHRVSKQGFESHYAVNTLAAYLLISLCRPLLRRSADESPSMVINMSSSAIKAIKQLDVGALANPNDIGGLTGAYAASKLALTVMGQALSEQLRPDNILVRSVDPGATMTPMIERGDGMPQILRWIAPLVFAKAEKQAAKVLKAADPAAFDDTLSTFYANGKQKQPPDMVGDVALQSRLLETLDTHISTRAGR